MPFEAAYSAEAAASAAKAGLAKKGSQMHFVYLLESESAPTHRYVGLSRDLKRRLEAHNSGESSHTAKYRPWHLTTYIAFSNKTKAEAFERYLKSGSGHAFAKRRLW